MLLIAVKPDYRSLKILMKPQKILFVDHTSAMGGAELSLLDLAIPYANGSKVLLFQDGPFHDRLKQSGITVKIVDASKSMLNLRTSGGIKSLAAIPEIFQLTEQIAREARGYDLILANSQKAFVVAALSNLKVKIPVFWYLRDILTARHFSKLNRLAVVFLANQFAERVVVNSHATGKAFVAAGGKEKLLNVVYNGFDSKRFDSIDIKNTFTLRSQLNIGSAPLVGLFSRFSYWKGQHLLLEAVKKLPEVHVILVGKALFGEEDYVSQLEDLSNEPELQGRIHWLGFRNDIPALMKACDIIIHTSTEPEPFGRVIVEGQLAQKPVIAAAAGGALEIIDDGVNGYLFPPEDAIALQKSIHKLISDRSLAQSLGEQGYISAKQKFSLENLHHSFAEAMAEH